MMAGGVVRAIVLSAGLATRLAPLSYDLPKALVPVVNQPVIVHEIRELRAAGITDIGLTYGPHTEVLAEYFGDGKEFGVNITWLWEPVPQGTGGALRLNRDFFGSEPLVVVPADILMHADLTALIAQHLAHPCGVTLLAAPRDLTTWTGDVVVANGVEGVSYHFKPSVNVGSNLGSCGTWIVEPATLDLLQDGFVDFSADFLPGLPHPACALGVYNAGDIYQRDFGQFWSYLAGNLEVVSGRSCVGLPEGSPRAAEPAVMRGPVLIGDDVIIEPGATLYGPSVIGPGAVIAAGAQVVSSVVLPSGKVPPGAFLANAVFGDRTSMVKVMMQHRNGRSACLGRLIVTSEDTL